MSKKLCAYIQLHIAVILYGFTAILGKKISISALNLVWWRVFITSISLLFLIEFGRQVFKMDKRLILVYSGIGILVSLHWITFYGAIKLANASIVLAALATTSFFTAILEPILTGKPFMFLELILGVLVIPPMILIAQNIDVGLQEGMWLAILSAFFAAIFSSLNKKWVNEASAYQISFIEMFSALIFISMILPFVAPDLESLIPPATDWPYLIVLALFCTTLAFILSMKALKELSAFDSALVINLEPVYGILLAIILLQEHLEMSFHFYVGVSLIMFVVFSHPFLQKKFYGPK